MDMSDGVKCKKFHEPYMEPEWRGMFFIKTGGVLFLIGAGFRRDTGGVSQLLET
jgi:hypothetical protein